MAKYRKLLRIVTVSNATVLFDVRPQMSYRNTLKILDVYSHSGKKGKVVPVLN
jgi:hypothetical protein